MPDGQRAALNAFDVGEALKPLVFRWRSACQRRSMYTFDAQEEREREVRPTSAGSRLSLITTLQGTFVFVESSLDIVI